MRISRLELTDFKCFSHLILEDLPDRVILVGPNGCGKSAILESIAIVKEYIGTYDPNPEVYNCHFPLLQRYSMAWRENAPLPIRGRQPFTEISIQLSLNETETEICGGVSCVTATVRIERSRVVTPMVSGAPTNDTLPRLFRSYDSESGIGIFDYIAPDRRYTVQQVTNLDLNRLSTEQQRRERIELPNPDAPSRKFANIKHFIISKQLEDTSVRNSERIDTDSLKLLKELFSFFFSPKNVL